MDRSLSETDLTQFQIDDVTPPSFVFSRLRRKKQEQETSDIKTFISRLMADQKKEIKNIVQVLTEVKQTNTNIESSIAFLSAQNNELQKKIEQLEGQSKRDREYITVLENKIEDMEMSSRKANFQLKNVPKVTGETKEDLIEMVICLSSNVDCKIEKKDIKDIYRVNSKKLGENNTPIVVETSSTIVKNDFLKMCKHFNIRNNNHKLAAKHVGCRTKPDMPIFVSEQLTIKGSRLYFLARDLAKTKNYKFCWTAYGKVYVKKDEKASKIAIKSEAQIQQLMQAI